MPGGIMRLPFALGAIALTALVAGPALTDEGGVGVGRIDDGVPNANLKVGTASTVMYPDFTLKVIATGIEPLENPSGLITHFGILSNDTQTEPDENTYLVLRHNPGGPTPGFDYGRRFLFQGHEMPNGNTNRAYITRINLDVAHPDHRITLMTTGDANAITGFNSIDGSTWSPLSSTLPFSQH